MIWDIYNRFKAGRLSFVGSLHHLSFVENQLAVLPKSKHHSDRSLTQPIRVLRPLPAIYRH